MGLTNQTLEHSAGIVKGIEGTQLSSVEVQALLGSPHFKHIDRAAVIRAGSKIFHTTEKNVEGWRQLQGADSQNVFVCLLAHLGEWADGIEVALTPNGGQQKQVNARMFDLEKGKRENGKRKTDKDGIDLPCLEDSGLGIACAMVSGPQGRKWTFFRICHTDEVMRRDGKKIPYVPPISSKPRTIARQPIPTQPAPERIQPSGEPMQSSMFDTSAFLSYETGGRR